VVRLQIVSHGPEQLNRVEGRSWPFSLNEVCLFIFLTLTWSYSLIPLRISKSSIIAVRFHLLL